MCYYSITCSVLVDVNYTCGVSQFNRSTAGRGLLGRNTHLKRAVVSSLYGKCVSDWREDKSGEKKNTPLENLFFVLCSHSLGGS